METHNQDTKCVESNNIAVISLGAVLFFVIFDNECIQQTDSRNVFWALSDI